MGTGSAVPPRVLTNHDLEKMVDTSDEWIRERTGIVERHVADERTASSDLAVLACRRAMETAGITPEEVDAVLVATVTPDTMFPCTACLVQKELGLKKAVAFDLSAACSGFIVGLTIGREYIAAGIYRRVLVVGVEVLSKILDWRDRNTCVLFGDGAGAVVLGACEPGRGILSYHLQSDGTLGDYLVLPAGGSRLPASRETVEKGLHYVKMSGNNVFKWAVRMMGDSCLAALERCHERPENLTLLIPHQANLRIIEATADRLSLPMERVFVNLDRYGNMSSASVPVALDEALRQGRLRDGDLLGMVAFGGGFVWGAVVVRW